MEWRNMLQHQKKKKERCIAIGIAFLMVFLSVFPQPSAALAAGKKAKPTLNKANATLKVGKKLQLKVIHVKKNLVKKITFTSDKKKIASVNKKGLVTAHKAGSTVVRCKVKLKNGKKYKSRCKIKVIQKETTKPSDDPEEAVSPAPGASMPVQSAAPEATAGTGSEATEAPPAPAVTDDVTPDPAATENASPAPTGYPERTPYPEETPGVLHDSKNGIPTVDNGVMREDMTAFHILDRMGIGINLGNTMESCGAWIDPSSVTNYETAWGAPVTTQEMFAGMKKAGFSSVRIPVGWSNMMSDDGNYTIHEDYLDRVETIMNYAFSEGLYVIVNIHFDGGWWARFGSQDAEEREQAMVKYKAIWQQIADRYEEYSDHLIFESANEELGSRLDSTDDYANSGYYEGNKEELYRLTNEINQTFVDIVRASGGNNAKRHLLIAGYDTNIGKTCNGAYKMPEDTIPDHLMVSVHYYSPAPYCLAEDPDNSWGFQDTWGTAEDIGAMKAELLSMKLNFADRGIPVVIGEYGVANARDPDSGYQRKKGKEEFIRNLCKYTLENGMCPVLWDTPGGTYNRKTCQIENELDAQVFLEMKELAELTPEYVPVPSKKELSWNGSISYSGWIPSKMVPGEEFDFILSSAGGCYALSGVDWSVFESPTLKLHCEGVSGNIGYKIALVTAGNEWWSYLENSDVKIQGNWNTSEDIIVDLSPLQLKDKDTFYLAFNASDFAGDFTLQITE